MDKIAISQPNVTKSGLKAVNMVLKSGQLVQGEIVSQLEREIARDCGARYAIATNSGTAALHTAYYGIGLGSGDEVITTPFTFAATINPLLLMGVKVKFADIDESDFCLDPKEATKKLTSKTRAIVPVDLYGQPAKYDELHHKGVQTVADACQAIGSKLNGKKVGSLADVSAFSFYATKNIMSGEGGIITTDSQKIATRCQMFRNHGQNLSKRYLYEDIGLNYRMTDIVAALLIDQVKRINDITRRRQERAARYTKNLTGINGLVLPVVRQGVKHCFHQYTLRILKNFPVTRDQLVEVLRSQGVIPAIYYPWPLHLQPAYRKLGYKKGDFPIAERVSGQVISLPVHPGVTIKQVDYVSNLIIKEYEKKKSKKDGTK